MKLSAALVLPLLGLLLSCRHVGNGSNTLSDQDFEGNEEQPSAPPPPKFAEGSDEAKIQAVLQTVAKNKLSRHEKADVQKVAREFLLANKLIKNDEEGPMGSASSMFSTQWGVTRIIDHGDSSVVLMNNRILQNNNFVENQPGEWLVLGLKQDQNGSFVLMPFEEAFALPKTIRVALASNPPEPNRKSLYYMEAQGQNLIEVMKALYTGQPIIGLSASLAESPNGKLDFDPTPHRAWRLVDPVFNLRRGVGADIQDVSADMLDNDYDATVKTSARKIAPRGAGAIRKVLLGTKWTEVLPMDLANLRRPGWEEE